MYHWLTRPVDDCSTINEYTSNLTVLMMERGAPGANEPITAEVENYQALICYAVQELSL